MPEIEERARLALDADTAWTRIGDFGAVGDWHPMLKSVESDGNAPGSRRVAHAADDGTQVERLQAYESDLRCYRYVIESTSLPVRDYSAEFRIDDGPAGDSVVTWRARFEVIGDDERGGVDTIRQFLEAGTDALRTRYE